MELNDKETAILRVLEQRAYYCDKAIRAIEEEIEKELIRQEKQINHLRAKMEGYNQAIDLLKEDLESIAIELEEDQHK